MHAPPLLLLPIGRRRGIDTRRALANAITHQVLWMYTVIINTVYSFLWDIYMDWGEQPRHHFTPTSHAFFSLNATRARHVMRLT